MAKDKKFNESIEDGPLKVGLYNEGYGIELGIRRNGYQTACCPVNDDIIKMLITLLTRYSSGKS